MKGKILKIAGFAILFFGIFIFSIGLGMYFEKNADDSDSGLPIAIASSAFMIPGFILVVLGFRERARIENEQLASICGIAKSYRRIALHDISKKLDVSLKEVYRLLPKAISKKMISGYIDRSSNEFFTSEALEGEVDVKICPSCGTPVDRVLLKGEEFKCESCGVVIN